MGLARVGGMCTNQHNCVIGNNFHRHHSLGELNLLIQESLE